MYDANYNQLAGSLDRGQSFICSPLFRRLHVNEKKSAHQVLVVVFVVAFVTDISTCCDSCFAALTLVSFPYRHREYTIFSRVHILRLDCVQDCILQKVCAL